ncbi:hypothetical protein [Dactylosporangium sp. NPDC048998]|uniref:hypothetical protein n=1 Tax=Dactylosporangium sp. NPDC048998 TaxID=3363976 RepID=UPI0037207E0C
MTGEEEKPAPAQNFRRAIVPMLQQISGWRQTTTHAWKPPSARWFADPDGHERWHATPRNGCHRYLRVLGTARQAPQAKINRRLRADWASLDDHEALPVGPYPKHPDRPNRRVPAARTSPASRTVG